MPEEDGPAEPPLGTGSGAEPPPTPRWVKMTGAILVVLLLLVVIVVAVGPGDHGPGRHAPSQAVDSAVAIGRSWAPVYDSARDAASRGALQGLAELA